MAGSANTYRVSRGSKLIDPTSLAAFPTESNEKQADHTDATEDAKAVDAQMNLWDNQCTATICIQRKWTCGEGLILY